MTRSNTILRDLVRNQKRAGADPLRPLIDAYLLERGRSEDRAEVGPFTMRPPMRPGGRLSPSSLCGCERQAVFKFVGVRGRKRINPDTELIFDDGDWRHHKWQSTFLDMEQVLGRERFRVISIEERVSLDDLYIAGSLDALLWIRPDPRKKGFRLLVDIKGINSYGFDRILMEGKPLEHHPKQLVAYLRARDVQRGYLLYDNKNNQRTLGYMVRRDDELWQEVESWATSVIGYLEQRRLPPKHPECNRGNFRYDTCPYREFCFGNMSEEEVREHSFEGFTGIDDAYRAGHARVEAHLSNH